MATKAQHTPGPWKVATRRNATWKPGVVYGSNGHVVVSVDEFAYRHSTTHRANLKLIASAPDLLAACRNLLELAATVHDHALADVIRNEARAAIARAEKGGAE